MKTKLLLPLLSALSYFSSPALAQTDVPTSKPQAVAPYKTSLGLHATWGGPSGISSELRLKHFVGSQSALELQAGLGQWQNRGVYQASLHYLWQPQLLTSSRFRPYAGFGVGAVGSTSFNEKQDMEIQAALLTSIGIEYTFPKLPLAVSVDYRHTLVRLNTHTFDAFNKSNMGTLGIGLKYTFGR
ncbi:hypothetical protein [uncultured Pontibacter sp.]|uniref:hypothetical protein n=1 Tax=uncultured Pontibacter sp. TaxID=453356 RepID=UPI00260CA212|nr:hypothetical protein [uncultured Pontibacter sp.]